MDLVTYQLITLVLTSTIIVGLCLLEYWVRSSALLPRAIGALTLVKQRFHCYGVDVSSKEGRVVLMNCLWMLRAIVVAFTVFIWESVVVKSQSVGRNEVDEIAGLCEAGWDCFKVASWIAPQLPTQTWDIKSVCGQDPDDSAHLCLTMPKPDLFHTMSAIAIASALSYIFALTFQMLLWSIFRDRTRAHVASVVTVILGAASVILLVLMLLMRALTAQSLGFAVAGVLPVIFWGAFVSGRRLRKLADDEFQRHNFRPLSELEEDADFDWDTTI